MRVKVVTGFVPGAFPAKHLSEYDCRTLGSGMLDAAGRERVCDFENGIEDCWANELLRGLPPVRPSCANPPADRFHTPYDMVVSNTILLQRYEWMARAANLCGSTEVFAWVEYTVLKQRNVTPEVIRAFVDRLELEGNKYDAISLPGCWPKGPINDAEAHWRFVGSVWVCPRKYAAPLYKAMRTVVKLRTEMTRTLSWDMNSMAYVELLDILPIRWYAANHDETQFTNF